jgi:hypothetical protein
LNAPGPTTYLSLAETDLDAPQLATRQVLRMMKGWTEEQMGIKQFHGPLATMEPLDLSQIISQVNHDLTLGASSEPGRGARWNVIIPETRPPDSHVRFFRMAHYWRYQAPAPLEEMKPRRGTLFLELGLEDCGINENGWANRAGLNLEREIPSDWFICYLTLTMADTESWAYPPAEVAACNARIVIDRVLLNLLGFDRSPLVNHTGSPWMHGRCHPVEREAAESHG